MNTWLIRFGVLVLALGIAADQRNAQSSEPQMSAISDYKTLPLVVEAIPSNTVNLLQEAVQSRAELRIRSAGLKPVSDVGPMPFRYVYINVNINGNAFNVSVQFDQYAVWDSSSKPGDGEVTTWFASTTGTHGNSSTFILEAVDELMDRFLNTYLKANHYALGVDDVKPAVQRTSNAETQSKLSCS
jgi:hypothetical protein